MNKHFYLLAGCFLAIETIDILTTRYIIGNGGYEANPVVATVVDSTPSFIALKFGISAIILLMALYAENRVKLGSGNVILVVVSLVALLPVISNTLVIARVLP